ncbi:MAG: hypothetical protein WD894_16855 [Pirellulales bacterium]
MFLLHERTRKSLCRVGFVALCVLPTCAVALWAASRNGDGHRARCEAELSRLLRLKVTLGDVEYPEPGLARYTDFLIADPETDAPIASAAALEIQRTDIGVAIATADSKIELGMATTLAELLHHRLRDRTARGTTPLRLAVSELLVAASNGDVSLRHVHVRQEPTSEGRAAQITFRTAEMKSDAQPAVLTIIREPDARIRFELFTQGAFDGTGNRFSPIVQLLRTLVGDNEVLVPEPGEAEELLKVSPLSR